MFSGSTAGAVALSNGIKKHGRAKRAAIIWHNENGI
jgi:hypothetical protein